MITYICLLSAGIILCLLLSAFFSGAEMAFSSANTVRLENLRENGNRGAKRALELIENFDSVLSAILIGNNLVNIASSSIASVLVIMLLSDSYAWVATVVMTILVIIFGETIPKIKSKKNATEQAIRYSGAAKFFMIILKPATTVVVWLVNFILLPFNNAEEDEEDEEESVEELQSIIETAEEEGVIDTDDSELIQNAIDFSDISASEVMTARVDVQAISIDDSWEEILEFVNNTPYSRIPVYKDSIDDVIGVLHLNRFFREVAENKTETDLKDLLMPPCYVYKTMKLPSVLNILKKAKQHLAIVTDEYSGTLGVVTMEDVLEQIVGDIWDETDTVETDVVVKNSNEFEVDGDLSISEFLELAEIDEDTFDYESETVGGWVIEMLERFPSPGDSFTFEDLEITVVESDELRVEKLLVKKLK